MKPFVIVSGYPRSGTSLMMRILMFGGIKVLADPERTEKPTATIGNPYGDFEFKDLQKTMKRLGPAKTAGRCAKIVAPYISDVPLDNRPKKVIFMIRPFPEIVASLMVMRTVFQHGPDVAVPAAIRHLETNEIDTLFVKFHELRQYPMSILYQIQDFIQPLDFDINEARKALDLNSRRGRKKINDGRELLYFDDLRDREVHVNERRSATV